MAKRSYRQFCAIARALDVLGDRWTLLVVRELLLGPRRFGDLQKNLPGIGTNLLSARLKELTLDGVIEKTELPPPAASTVYRLTARGQRLRSVIFAVGAWGSPLADAPEKRDTVRPWWALLLLNGRIYHPDTKIPPTMNEGFELHADDEVLHLVVRDGKVTMGQGPLPDATVRITADGAALASILSRRTSFDGALEKGTIEVEGDAKRVRDFARILALPTA